MIQLVFFFDCLFNFCSNFEFAFIIFQKYWRISNNDSYLSCAHRFVSKAGAASAEQSVSVYISHACRVYMILVLLCVSNTFTVFVILFLFSYHHSRAIFSTTHYYVFEFFFFLLFSSFKFASSLVTSQHMLICSFSSAVPVQMIRFVFSFAVLSDDICVCRFDVFDAFRLFCLYLKLKKKIVATQMPMQFFNWLWIHVTVSLREGET